METQLVDEILAWPPANKGCDLSYSHRTSYLTVQQQGTGSAERQKRAIASVGSKVRAPGNRVLAIELKPSCALRGIQLQADEIQMSIAGKAVGFGIAPTDAFLRRVGNAENLLYRTAERKQGKPYRDRGRRDKSLSENVQLFMTVPRAASFAVTFRVGASEQLSLPGLGLAEQVIDELVECLALYKSGDEERLHERITEEAYYHNFMGLAQNIAPDGRNVELVGFTTVRGGAPKQVQLTRTRQDAREQPPKAAQTAPTEKSHEATVEVTGTLVFADSRKMARKAHEIQIVSTGNIHHTIFVPEGMMSDVVKPLWEEEVTVTGTQKGKKIHLMQIRPAEPD